MSVGNHVFPAPSFIQHCDYEWCFPDILQCSQIRRIAKTEIQVGTIRQKKVQGFYSGGSQARLQMQPPFAVPVPVLPAEEQQPAASMQQRNKLPNTWR